MTQPLHETIEKKFGEFLQDYGFLTQDNLSYFRADADVIQHIAFVEAEPEDPELKGLLPTRPEGRSLHIYRSEGLLFSPYCQQKIESKQGRLEHGRYGEFWPWNSNDQINRGSKKIKSLLTSVMEEEFNPTFNINRYININLRGYPQHTWIDRPLIERILGSYVTGEVQHGDVWLSHATTDGYKYMPEYKADWNIDTPHRQVGLELEKLNLDEKMNYIDQLREKNRKSLGLEWLYENL